jgi:hypothetical protein
MATLKHLYDPGGTNDKGRFIEIWLDRHIWVSGPFFFQRHSLTMPQQSIQSSAKSSRSSLQSSISMSSLSSKLDARAKAIKASVKHMRNAVKTIAQPLKRAKHAVSSHSSQAGTDAEADELPTNNNVSTVSNDLSEVIEVDSDGEGSNKLEQELGMFLDTSFCSLLVILSSSCH